MKLMTCCIILFLLFYKNSYGQDGSIESVKEGELIVKFKFNSEMLLRLQDNPDNFSFKEFKKLLGEHKCRPLISEGVIKAYNKKYNALRIYPGFRSDIKNPVENLMRIFLIDYEGNINPKIAARKISSFPDVEYAEPLPERSIIGIPDDPEIKNQYYLPQIKAFEAWEKLSPDSIVLIGIVDTGVDYMHPDLGANIYINNGEYGLDSLGIEKSTNGIDDDNNGFIDDWHGWDFTSSTSPDGQDNDPMPGHSHGTHVAGTAAAVTNNGIGIAGVAINAKILPVKIGDDNSSSTSVSNSYDGILYAASIGAQIINCSWGGDNRSEAEQEIISAAEELGSLVVAAAGNNGKKIAFYPAAYKNVLSVAAVDDSDRKATFSNYHNSIDVSAPGVGIYATFPDNNYGFNSGTSMASPIAAGVAALARSKFTDYIPLQLAEHIKITCDNIDSINPTYVGYIGNGRVNANNCVMAENGKSLVLADYSITDENGDGDYDPSEMLSIGLTLQNVLYPVYNVQIKAKVNSKEKFKFLKDSISAGDFITLEKKQIEEAIIFRVPPDIPIDYELELKLEFTDESGNIGRDGITLYFNPSYRTLSSNNIAATFNSRGNIGFNDYPSNMQGEGFKYKKSYNTLYEGSLMVGVSSDKVSNVARGDNQSIQDKSFHYNKIFRKYDSSSINATIGESVFSDSDDSLISGDSLAAGIKVLNKVFQFKDNDKLDFIIVLYDVINISDEFRDSVYAGLYFDWDLGPAGSDNQVLFDNDNNFGYVKNVYSDSLPYIGVKLLSNQYLNFFAIDNDGTSPENPGVWDGFTLDEKWAMLTSGIKRKESSITDVSVVIGGGPVSIRKGDTVRFAFSIFCGDNFDEMKQASKLSLLTAEQYDLDKGFSSSTPLNDNILNVYPNPGKGDEIFIEFSIFTSQIISLKIYDINGKLVDVLIQDKNYNRGFWVYKYKLLNISKGTYFILLETEVSKDNWLFVY